MAQTLEDQVKVVIKLLRSKASGRGPLERNTPTYLTALEWARLAPGKIDGSLRQELIQELCAAFAISEEDIVRELAGVKSRTELNSHVVKVKVDEESILEALLPKGGWFEHYIEYTRYNEAPMSYHIASGLVALGCALGRRCYIDMGHHRIYAPMNCILIGPTGIVHKSTAVNIAGDLIRRACLCAILADKITAESLVTCLMESPQQFIPVPELAIFFGKQKYLEGLSTLIIRLLDYPAEFAARTQARQLETIAEPTISILGGSTMSLLTDSTPDEVLSSGFLNRFLMIVEDDTERCFPKPRKGQHEDKLLKLLTWLKGMSGEVKLNEPSEAYAFYHDWYYRRKRQIQADKAIAEVTQRGADHLLRLAMLTHLSHCNTLVICLDCIKTAAALLAFYERKVPSLVKAIHSNTQTSSTDYVVEILQRLGGAADHSTLLRRVSSRINAAQFKQVILTLNESGRLRASIKGVAQWYVLKEEDHGSS